MRLTEQQLSGMEQWAAFDLGSGTAKESGDRVQDMVDEIRAWRTARDRLRALCNDAPSSLADERWSVEVGAILAEADPDGVP